MEETPATPAQQLGARLRRARRDRPLSAVAAQAEISTAYLQKLEAGLVKQPSPHVLHHLASALDVGYAELMRLVGYVVPDTGPRRGRRPPNELTYALSSEELTDEEAAVLREYLDWYRSRRT
jgi:HTH-type transcriptional regulator, competence development regulator